METSIQEAEGILNHLCPCRESLISTLLKYITIEGVTTDALFLYGNSGAGKTHVIKTFFDRLQVSHSYVNCIEHFTSRHLYHKILKDSGFPLSKTCPSMMEFCRLLKLSDLNPEETFYVILDKAERLRTNMDAHLLPAFMRLSELTNLNICVIFITDIVLEKFFPANGFVMPIPIHFPDYTKSEMVTIMALDAPKNFGVEIYKRYCQTVVDVFYLACRDTNELRHLAMINFEKYYEPIVAGKITENEIHKLWQNIAPHLRKAVKTVYLRQVSSDQWKKLESADKEQNSFLASDETKVKNQVELPYYSKYLLLAAYFASHNPATTDRRFFTKKSAGRMSKRAKASVKAAKNLDKKFLGPKPFQLDRLMAIFYSIVEGGASSSANILTQLSGLVTLQLLAKTSSDDQIDTPKYKCLVPFEFAQSVAKQIDLDMAEYLYDHTW